jgi:hypothetical protein
MDRQLIPRLKALNAEIAPQTGRTDAFGAMFDTSSKSPDHPVALVVGINYGQIGTSTGRIGATEDNIGYHAKISELAASQRLAVVDFAVVLWNFFPYLTDLPWTEQMKNSKQEAAFLFEEGYPDPLAVFEHVHSALRPEILVFHGVGSAVPILAHLALRRIRRRAFLVDNLSRGLKLATMVEIGGI